ncbi:MAG: DUF3955 domain-containing protein [Gammaproteobacteria bacterium]|nr:DUF3955 domain-containing protein [Gammaproteobacteria bacterium]
MRILVLSTLILVMGLTCIFLENYFYQYVDEQGVLHESLFMPLGSILILLAGIGLVFF